MKRPVQCPYGTVYDATVTAECPCPNCWADRSLAKVMPKDEPPNRSSPAATQDNSKIESEAALQDAKPSPVSDFVENDSQTSSALPRLPSALASLPFKWANITKKIFGSASERQFKTYASKVKAINALEPQAAALSDEELRSRTLEFRVQLANGVTLDDLLVPAFATVREVAKRTLGEYVFDVQLIGGMVLHEGAIAEIRAGEGKVLSATLAVYLNALAGKGVHVVTLNDHLARRDAEWMGQIYKFLGMSVGVVIHDLMDDERAAAYACDITYGTNNEFGFDYLRDNMKYEFAQMVQRGHSFAIVDEVDSILIDEARTPIVISAASDASDKESDLCNSIARLVANLGPEDFEIDEIQRAIYLTDPGSEHMEKLLREAGLLLTGGALDEPQNFTLAHHINQALRARKLFQRDKDYLVRKGEVVVLDEFTGRMMPGRRYSEGLHQALEAKEHVQVQPENVTLTFQNYFRLYDKLAGMTCTASTEADEFSEIYKLDVVEIPTNLPVKRADEDDGIYRTAKEKIEAIVAEIKDANSRMQPILVGATSIEKSEQLAEFLLSNGYKMIDFADPKSLTPLYEAARAGKPSKRFAVLNARFHEQKAYIVAEAGVPGAITIATDMAVRGADIQLGGNVEMRVVQECAGLVSLAREMREAEIRDEVGDFKEKAIAAGGLYVIGTERHESRRMDNQLRTCSGRNGQPGRTKFFLSLQDDLMRIFGSERMDLVKLGLQEGEPIVHARINKAVEDAQRKVEARKFDIRKNVLKFDDVMNDQRILIYLRRREIMADESVEAQVADMREDVVDAMVSQHIPHDAYAEAWDVKGLAEEVKAKLNLDLPVADWAKEEGIADEEIKERLLEAADTAYAERVEKNTEPLSRMIEKQVVLQSLDTLWREHLVALDHLRQTIDWRGLAQRDPLNEYKSEALELFKSLMTRWDETVTAQLMRVEVSFDAPRLSPQELPLATADFSPQALAVGTAPQRDPGDPATWGKVGRNEPCPCGSGKNYKHWHGSLV